MEFNNIEPLTPRIIVNEVPALRFNIPLYQRLFEWSERQLKGLLHDLASHIRCGKNTPYYIGMMTGNESDPIDLIDGQQRFTTLLLLGIVLRDHYPEWERFATKQRLAFSARPEDRRYLESLIDRREDCDGPVNERIKDGCRIIREFLDAELADYGIGKEVYAEKIFDILTFFVYKLPSCYKEQPRKLNKYFEAMNSSGRSLEQHEKLKVDLLSRADAAEDKASLNNIWNLAEKLHKPVFCEEEVSADEIDCYIRQVLRGEKTLAALSKEFSSSIDMQNVLTVEQIKPSAEVPLGREIVYESSSIVDFEELLLLALDITTRQEQEEQGQSQPKPYNRSKLEVRFRDLPQDRIPVFYKNLFVCRLILDRFVIRIAKEGQRNRYMLNMGKSETDKEVSRLRQYQSMLYAGGEMHLWLTPLVEWIMARFEQSGAAPAPGELFAEIRNIDDSIPSHGCPAVGMLRYHESASVYFFQRLDYLLWERYAVQGDKSLSEEYRDLVKEFTFSSNRSVEHLHPQDESRNEVWPDAYGGIAEPIHTLGNLALISAGFNSEQRHDNENLKRARIKEQIDRRQLQSIKLLVMYDLALKNGDCWSVDIALEHGREMMALLKSSYSGH